MAAFKQHCAFEFWRGRRREAAERGKGDEAMGQFGRITSIADVPARRELLRIVKQAIAQAEAPPSAPRKPRLAAPKPAATGAPIETSALLQERNFGDLRGLAYDDLSVNPLTMREAPPGGESAEAFQRRVALAFGLMVKRRAALGGTLAVVTHGLVIRALLGTHLRMPDATPVPAHLGNTSVSIVEARPPHRVTLLDCTSHLDAGSLDDANALSGG
jgi:probable phosphoglycerate mutase